MKVDVFTAAAVTVFIGSIILFVYLFFYLKITIRYTRHGTKHFAARFPTKRKAQRAFNAFVKREGVGCYIDHFHYNDDNTISVKVCSGCGWLVDTEWMKLFDFPEKNLRNKYVNGEPVCLACWSTVIHGVCECDDTPVLLSEALKEI